MDTELEKIIAFAEKECGATKWHGKCQAFVARCYEAGTGKFISCNSAKTAEKLFLKPGTSGDLNPPVGAAVYFAGDGELGKKYGHTALSVGGGYIIDPVSSVVRQKLTAGMHNGYHGWGWLGTMPEGASETAGGTVVSSGTGAKTAAKEITSVKVKSSGGETGKRAADRLKQITNGRGIQIAVQNGSDVFVPVLADEVTLTSQRSTSAATLKFSVIEDEDCALESGCPVAFRYNGTPMFYGYIFEIERKTGNKTSVTCYDQLRYLKNKDSFVYNLSYSGLVKFIAERYSLNTGVIEDTGYVIPTRVEENTLLDILGTAADLTAVQTGNIFVLYDNFGALTLKSIGNMLTNICVDADTAETFSVKSSIDSDVYNRIVLAKDNKETGERELYIANDAENQSKWGILQYYEKADEEDPAALIQEKLKQLLKFYDIENKHLTVSGCIGHPSLRGGGGVIVIMKDRGVKNYMICEKVEHKFIRNEHFMDLELSGGGFRV